MHKVEGQRSLDITLATIAMVTANVFGASIAAVVKLIGTTTSTFVILFFQFSVCFMLVLPIVLRRGWRGFYTKHPVKHLVRAIIGTFSFWLYYKAIGVIPLVNASLLTLTAPIWVPMIARVVIQESIPKRAWLGIGCGFIGVVVVLWPLSLAINIGSLMALGSGITLAVVYVMLKDLSRTEHSSLIILYYAGFTTASMLIPFILSNTEIRSSPIEALVILGFLIFALDYTMLFSFRRAPASIMSSLTYLTVVFSGLIDWLYWDYTPGVVFVLGSLLIFFGGTWTTIVGHYGAKQYV